MTDLPRQEIVLFYGTDKDIQIPVYTRGDEQQPADLTGATTTLRVDDLLGRHVTTLAGTVNTTTETATFAILGSVFGTGATKLRVGQYRWAAIITQVSRPVLVAHGYLTVVRIPAAS